MKLLSGRLGAVLAMSPLPAAAVVVLDQDNIMPIAGPVVASSIGLAVERRQAQIVTAGQTGKLVRVDLQLGRGGAGTAPLALELVRGGAASLPMVDSATPFLISAIPPTSATSLISIDVSSANFMLTAGEQFMLYLRATDYATANRLTWVIGYGNGQDLDNDGFEDTTTRPYAGGENYLRDTISNQQWLRTGFDRGFATYVDVAGGAVPEPASWALMIAGFGMTGAVLRRRRRTAIA